MKHHSENLSIAEYIFIFGRFLELAFSGIFIWFALDQNRYLLEHDLCDELCHSRCYEFIVAICFVTFSQGLSVIVVFNETFTLFFLNVSSLMFLLGFAIDFKIRILYLSVIWTGRSLYKAVKLCINGK
jgi:hypothetical protein